MFYNFLQYSNFKIHFNLIKIIIKKTENKNEKLIKLKVIS